MRSRWRIHHVPNGGGSTDPIRQTDGKFLLVMAISHIKYCYLICNMFVTYDRRWTQYNAYQIVHVWRCKDSYADITTCKKCRIRAKSCKWVKGITMLLQCPYKARKRPHKPCKRLRVYLSSVLQNGWKSPRKPEKGYLYNAVCPSCIFRRGEMGNGAGKTATERDRSTWQRMAKHGKKWQAII